MNLNRIKERTTRYKGEDGRERAVLLWDDYEELLAEIERLEDIRDAGNDLARSIRQIVRDMKP